MDNNTVINLGILGYFLGILLSFGYPYLTVWLNTREKFEWRKIVSQVLGGLITGLIIIVAPGFTDQLVELSQAYDYYALYFISIVLMAYGGAEIGNVTEKLGRAIT